MASGTDPDRIRGLIHARAGSLLLAGPTASGKSAVALELADRLDGEILSADSMQVFRGLDLGTAKPTGPERGRVPHHLIDLVGAAEPFDTARWLTEAKRVFEEVRGRGKVPIFCGGTGLYFSAWTHGLDAPAPGDPAVRQSLESEPLERLLAELRERDPATFERIDRRNPRRVVRALEILRLTGRPIPPPRPVMDSSDTLASGCGEALFVLRRDPADLRGRIEKRVDAMFASGLVEEVRMLMGEGLGAERTALQAIGYRQVVEHLRGDRDLTETVALVKSRTWQFARRQQTWFRNQLPARWIDVPPGESPPATARRILENLTAPATPPGA